MNIVYLHASKFGNGATVAAEFQRQMAARGVTVEVHHIREVKATELSTADLYVFSSPGRLGRPIGRMRRFLKQVHLPPGTPYALLTTEAAPKPDQRTGRIPTEQEQAKWQRVRPIMNEILQGKGLVRVAEDTVHVTGLKGPLEDGWRDTVQAFAGRIPPARQAPHRRARAARRASSPAARGASVGTRLRGDRVSTRPSRTAQPGYTRRDYLMKRISAYFGSGQRSSATIFSS